MVLAIDMYIAIQYLSIMDNSQHTTGTTVYQYCILKVETKLFNSKVDLVVDLGQRTNDLADNVARQTLQVSEYHHIVDGLNYLSTLGWEIVNIHYRELSGTTYNNPQYLLKRKINR
jgi:hypothetical protein